MTTACPVIKYGIPETGAPEYNINSGREIFRCGFGENSCVKIYITNVSLEKSTTFYKCRVPVSSMSSDKYCIESVNFNERLRTQEEWIAKPNVDSSLPNGTVITKLYECGSSNGVIPLYWEKTLRIRSLLDIANISELDEIVLSNVKSEIGDVIGNDTEFILNDISTSVSPTDWERANLSYMAIESPTDKGYQSFRYSWNIQNGRVQETYGRTYYDNSDKPQNLADVIKYLLSIAK
jgi:hypothetical protein